MDTRCKCIFFVKVSSNSSCKRLFISRISPADWSILTKSNIFFKLWGKRCSGELVAPVAVVIVKFVGVEDVDADILITARNKNLSNASNQIVIVAFDYCNGRFAVVVANL
uniref:Uncharacterized protein n=1 Tax=Romanomermis culicivorax TaxID=13658 RepID=A0A915L886_ROMCU